MVVETSQIVRDASQWDELSAPQQAQLLAALGAADSLSPREIDAILGILVEPGEEQELVETCLAAVWRSWQVLPPLHAQQERPNVDLAAGVYRKLKDVTEARYYLLRALAADRRPEAYRAFAELMASDPPQNERAVALALAPLFQRPDQGAAELFPRLLDALAHRHVAASVLDLTNFLARRGITESHPASSRVDDLIRLLAGLIVGLERIEKSGPTSTGGQEAVDAASRSPSELAAAVHESLAIIVSLCDALALIGDHRAIATLRSAAELSHRRVRAEAAAALARLGQKDAVEWLAALTAEPVVRTRAAAYLRELGHPDKIPAEFDTALARAEGDFSAWLAEPSQFGIPPHELELVDEAKLHWPGYAEKVPCFLLRFRYRLGTTTATGIGIAGPLVSASMANLEDLPPADIYAYYAGRDAAHPEINDTPVEGLDAKAQAEWREIDRELAAAGFSGITLAKQARFFDQTHWVAHAERDGRPGTIVVDGGNPVWYASGSGKRALGPDDAYDLHKGRQLLRAFNRQS